MKKRTLCSLILVIAIVILMLIPVFAQPVTGAANYEITVTPEGGKYQFENIQLIFKKGFLGKDFEPVTFNVALYAENGVPYIDIEPSIESFAKDVIIKVKKGSMSFYDVVTNETIEIELDSYNLKVKHFSRYIVID